MTILIAEDEFIIGAALRIHLENAGHVVSGVHPRGAGAIAAARDRRPDMLIMDVRLLDEVDGIEAATRINDGIPVVYTTAYVDSETISRATATAPVAILEKPVDYDELIGIVTRVDADRA